MRREWLILCCMVLLASCSTQKNTWLTRNYHAMTTRYNIYFNGNNSYKEGLAAIDNANQDDYSQVIPLYPVSNHSSVSAASSQMDRAIEKCRKCIKTHSIKTKPKKNPKKAHDPKYKAFMAQEEYNREMSNAWLLLGQAEFHKGDFLGSIGTFNYIIRHYENDADVVAQCQLWEVRAYAEMGWMYEAEELLGKVQQDNLKRKHSYLYAAAVADLKLKQQTYREAIPFVKLGLEGEKGTEKARYRFVLGQLYELEGNRTEAAAMYKKVLNSNPSSEMDFNARMRKAEMSGNQKQLLKMAKQEKNKDRLDQIYGAVGNIYLQKKDTTKALEYYDKAIESSTQNGMAKAVVLVKAGDLYYNQRNYVKAAPCYSEAATILSSESDGYKRIRKRSETLDELIVEYNTVQLQDSLQRLALLTEEEQLAIAKKIIADLEQREKEEAEAAAQAERDAQNSGLLGVNTLNMLGGNKGNADWYFYNAQLIKQGKQEFMKRWGNRQLEDNWRRQIKTMTSNMFGDEGDDNEEFPTDSLTTDSLKAKQGGIVTDVKDPQYYLQQIPKTEEDIQQSNRQIANALYNMIFIYRDKIEDEPMADETFEDFLRRFPQDSLLLNLYYNQYLTCLKKDDKLCAEQNRQKILSLYPNTEQAKIASNPNYFEQMMKMQQEQDSVYESTYAAYLQNDYKTVKDNKLYAETNYPMSRLMPRFLFLNAIAVAKTENQEAFISELRDLVQRYPDSELGAMAKNMLAMMNQGEESQKGGDNSSLLAGRTDMMQAEQPDSTLLDKTFSTDTKQTAFVLLTLPHGEQTLNQLLYEVALFNFSQFMIKDFDLKQIPMFTTTLSALQISGFESYEEAIWYSSLLRKNADLQRLFSTLNVEIIEITEENFQLLNTRYTLDEYRTFQLQQL